MKHAQKIPQNSQKVSLTLNEDQYEVIVMTNQIDHLNRVDGGFEQTDKLSNIGFAIRIDVSILKEGEVMFAPAGLGFSSWFVIRTSRGENNVFTFEMWNGNRNRAWDIDDKVITGVFA